MTIVVAGIDVSRKTLNIRLNGRDDTDGFRKIAGILTDGGAERVGDAVEARAHLLEHPGHRQMPAEGVAGYFAARPLPVSRQNGRSGTKSLRTKIRDARATD